MLENTHNQLQIDNINAVSGLPLVLLRLEGLAILAGASIRYGDLAPASGWGWESFAILFLVPDLSMLGYLIGRRVGAIGYNIGHSYLLPALLAAGGWWYGAAIGQIVALIWIAHIGFDRAMGYGLKYGSGFGDTHLGRKGRAVSAASAAA